MIEEIKKLAELNKEIEEKYNFISVRVPFAERYISVHVSELSTLLDVANGNDVYVSDHDETYPYKISFYEDEIHFFILLDEEGYREYKNSRATNTTKEKSGTL